MSKKADQVGTPNPQGSPMDGQGSQWLIGAVNELTRSIGRLEGTLTGISDKQSSFDSKLMSVADDVKGLNRKIWYASGAVSVAVAVAAFVFYLAAQVFSNAVRDNLQASKAPVQPSASPAAVSASPHP